MDLPEVKLFGAENNLLLNILYEFLLKCMS